MAEHIKKCAALDVVVAGDFNESITSENIMNFVIEKGLYDVFTETNGIDVEKRSNFTAWQEMHRLWFSYRGNIK